MMKRIYAYLNDGDLSVILLLLQKAGIQFYDKDNCLVNTLPSISDGIKTFYLSSSSNSYIEYQPCFYTSKYLQCCSFSLKKDKDANLRAVFQTIKKSFQKNFTLSQDKMYYIGPGIYKQWVENSICLPTLLKYRKLQIEHAAFPAVIEWCKREGFTFAGNDVRLRDIENCDLIGNSFVIYDDIQHVKRRIANKNIIRYELGSACIFIYKNTPQTYSFVLDERLIMKQFSKIVQLFMEIEQRFVKKTD